MGVKEKRGRLPFRYLRVRKISITSVVRLATNLDTDVGDANNGKSVNRLRYLLFRPAHGGNGLDLGVRTAIPFRHQFG